MADKIKLSDWDTVEYLVDEESIRLYLEAVVVELDGDLPFLADALGSIVRARAINRAAEMMRMPREALYAIFAGKRKASPELLLRLSAALGYQVTLDPPSVLPARPVA